MNPAFSPVGQAGGSPLHGAPIRLPLLTELIQDQGTERRVWWDLGAAKAALVNRLAPAAPRLIVSNWPTADSASETSLLAGALSVRPLDCVLCWDLLNYQGQAELARLSSQIEQYAHPDCRVHALIVYATPQMPAKPCNYRVDADFRLHTTGTQTGQIDAPRYSPKALEKAMPALKVQKTMLLNNGMQEFLLGLRDG